MNFLEAMKFRHACKIFDENKKISAGEFDFILEAGRLSPSSTGLEQWDFLVVQNPQLRQKIRAVSWDQPQITTCSHLVVILAKVAEVKGVGKYVEKMIERREDKAPDIIGDDDELIYNWSSKQCYIAAANMMTAAASLGIDSCPIEGFDEAALNGILGLDTSKQRVAIVVPFGYRLKPQPKKYRREINDVVKWIY